MKNSIIKENTMVALQLQRVFVIRSNDYHTFDEAKHFFKQAGIQVQFKERGLENGVYVADFEIVGVYQ